MEILTIDNFPSWAACYVAYADLDSVSEQEQAQIDQYLDDMRSDGWEFAGFGDDTGFYNYPEFGLACDCIRVNFIRG